MREYELTVIVHPDTESESITELVETLTSLITDAGGDVQRVGQLINDSGSITEHSNGDWQKRKLAYPIRKELEGYYLILQAQMDTDVLPPLERNLKLSELVMRHLLVRLNE